MYEGKSKNALCISLFGVREFGFVQRTTIYTQARLHSAAN